MHHVGDLGIDISRVMCIFALGSEKETQVLLVKVARLSLPQTSESSQAFVIK